jgi:hypothetical protein
VLSRVAPAFLLLAGCLQIHLGKDDGIEPVTFDQTLSGLAPQLVPAPAGAREVNLTETLVVIDAAKAADDLNRFGPDKIGAIRGVSISVEEEKFDGLDLTRAPKPTIYIGTAVLGPDDDGVDLDDETVNTVRADLLTPQAVAIPFTMRFTIPADAPDALGPKIHVRLVLQPTLTVDIGHSW